MTIYYYESDQVDGIGESKGMPVVLKFTDSDKFLKCSRTGDDVTLSVMVSHIIKNIHLQMTEWCSFCYVIGSFLTSGNYYTIILCLYEPLVTADIDLQKHI